MFKNSVDEKLVNTHFLTSNLKTRKRKLEECKREESKKGK